MCAQPAAAQAVVYADAGRAVIPALFIRPPVEHDNWTPNAEPCEQVITVATRLATT
jgi:hypothetical protein